MFQHIPPNIPLSTLKVPSNIDTFYQNQDFIEAFYIYKERRIACSLHKCIQVQNIYHVFVNVMVSIRLSAVPHN